MKFFVTIVLIIAGYSCKAQLGKKADDSIGIMENVQSRITAHNEWMGKWKWIDCRDTIILDFRPVEVEYKGNNLTQALGWLRYSENGSFVVDNLAFADSSFNLKSNVTGISINGKSASMLMHLNSNGRTWQIKAMMDKKGKKMYCELFPLEMTSIYDPKYAFERFVGRTLPKKMVLRKVK